MCMPTFISCARQSCLPTKHVVWIYPMCCCTKETFILCSPNVCCGQNILHFFTWYFCVFKHSFYSGNHFCRLVLYLSFLPVFCELCLSKGNRLSSLQQLHVFHNGPSDQSVKFLLADILWSRQVKSQLLMPLLSNALVLTLKICNN